MQTKCPKVATTRWLSLGRVLLWFARHCVRILQYIEERNPPCKPSVSWWISLLALRRVTDEVNILFKSLQFGSLLVTQQVEAFSKFIGVLHEKFSVQGPLLPLQLTDWDAGAAVCDGSFVIRSTDVTTFMQGLGSTE